MGWVTSEDMVKWLTINASLSCLAVSALFLLVSAMPWFYFRGYLMGYYSPLDYRMWYSLTGKPVAMPHTDYVRHVTVTFTTLSALLLAVSATSLLLVRRRLRLVAGAVYGASAGLVILHGLLYGYIYRAVGTDMSMLSPVVRDEVVVRTLAGVIAYEGARVEHTIIYRLAFETPVVLVILVLAVASSTASVLLLLLRLERVRATKDAGAGRGLANQVLPVAVASMVMLASVFSYYPASVAVAPQPPPVTLEAPLYNYTCTALSRTSRGVLTYTDFEVYPVPGWASFGGVWELSAGGGFKGNALRGRDNNGGVGGVSSQYYWNTRIDGYASLWVSVKVRAEGADDYKGIGLLNADRTRLYEISVRSTATIYKWDGTWRELGRVSVPGYSATRWYTLVLYYVDRGTAVDLTLWIHDDTGALVATLSVSDTGATRFRPAYAGVTIDATTTLWFRFDDFIVSTIDPRSILFTGFTPGMRVEVWDNLGFLVNSTTAPAASFRLNVTADIVVGTGVDGRIVVRYPDAYLCGNLTVPLTDAILGGDSYALTTRELTHSLGYNKTSGVVWVYVSYSELFTTASRVFRLNSTRTMYARLVLEYYEARTTLHANVTLIGRAESTPIVVRAGVPATNATSFVELNAGLANFIAVYAHYYAPEPPTQVSRLDLRLELCTQPDGRGACVSYPVRLMLVGYVEWP